MADAVIGGLVLSTALSLLVVPAFYVVADRLRGVDASVKDEAREEELREAGLHPEAPAPSVAHGHAGE
jgi:hypothetical protein